MKKCVKYTAILLPAAVVIAFMILWLTGALGIWTFGIPYIAANTNVFTDKNGRLLPGEYSVTIDLSSHYGYDPNYGKELYNDGENIIYVALASGSSGNSKGSCIVQFRSVGKYSTGGATLVSGARHTVNSDGSVTPVMTVKMTAEYEGKTYGCVQFSEDGATALYKNRYLSTTKDGDWFTFLVFPPGTLGENWEGLDDKGEVKLTVTGLYENVWTRK